MFVIGITGGTGTGKTTALEVVRELGGAVIDCDEVYHRLLETDKEMLAAIEAAFPGTVEGGVLQRKKLGQIVFGDPEKLQRLNGITHGFVKKAVDKRLAEARREGKTLAAGLFASLRARDTPELRLICARGPSEEGMGRAVVNRLKKAAGGKITCL